MSTDLPRAPGRTEGLSQRPVLAALILAVCVIVAAVFWPVLSATASSFDDDEYLVEPNPVNRPGWASIRQAFTEVLHPTVLGYYEPISLLSLMADYALGGRIDNLRPFHRTNLALHAANTALVIVLLYLLVRRAWPAALAGLLFGLHPLCVEPVALAAQRKALLAPFFCLWCLILYVRYAQSGPGGAADVGGRRHWPWLAGSALMYVLAMMSKPTSVPLPAVLLLLDFWPLRRLGVRAVVEKIPYFVVGGVFAVITILSTDETAGITVPVETQPARTSLTVLYLIPFYLAKTFWPVNLSSVYPLPRPLALSNSIVAAAVVATGALLIGLVVSLRWTRALVTGWLIFFVTIFPTLGIISYSWVTASDKYMYLPFVGFLLPLAWLLRWGWGDDSPGKALGRRRAVVAVVVGALAVAEAVGTRSYLRDWRDTETLFRRMVRLAPDTPYPRNYLGIELCKKGNTPEAILHFSIAAKLAPDNAYVHNNFAMALEGEGRLEEAIFHYREAVRCGMNTPVIQTAVALLLARRADYDAAARHLHEALRLDPRHADAWNILGNISVMRERFDEAIDNYRKALAVAPDFGEARHNLAIALMRKGRLDDAVRELRTALETQPELSNARCTLAGILAAQGRHDEAAAEYREVLRRDPGHSLAAEGLRSLTAERSRSRPGP